MVWPKIYHSGQKWPFHLIRAWYRNRENDHNAPRLADQEVTVLMKDGKQNDEWQIRIFDLLL